MNQPSVARLSRNCALGVLVTCSACRSVTPDGPHTPDLATDAAAVEQVGLAYAAAFVREDVPGLLALLTDDFVALTAGRPPLEGRERVGEEIAADLRGMRIETLSFDYEELVLAGDVAYVRGRSRAAVVVEAETQVLAGSFLWILRRCSDGVWRLARDSAHAYPPPSAAEMPDRRP